MYIFKSKESVIAKALEILETEPEYKTVTVSAPVKSPKVLKTISSLKIGGSHRESFLVFFMDTQHRILANEILFKGTIDCSAVYPREIAKRAFELNAAALAFAHNHPSGETAPSQSDITLTQRLVEGLELLGIRVIDHIIVSSKISDAFSFAENQMI